MNEIPGYLNRVTVWCDNGYSWVTSFNGTEQDAINYFLGQYVDTAPYPLEVMSRVVAVRWEKNRKDI